MNNIGQKIQFNDLPRADLMIDSIYEGGAKNGKASEVLSKLLPGCSNSGGFRKVMRKDGSGLPAYVVLYTSMEELEWPDFLDEETGIFRYYGDNRKPGASLLNTPKKGNVILEKTFDILNSKDKNALIDIPPFLIFKKTGVGWDVQFLGLAAPGNPKISPDKDLVSFWRTLDGNRFQNYEAYFTVLNISAPITKEWLNSLIYDHDNNLKYAPAAWKKFIKKGRSGIEPLISSKLLKIPSKFEQLQSDNEGNICLKIIRDHYKDNPYGFENCAINILKLMDYHFESFSLTRPWRDGGRDAIGMYVIGNESKANYSLKIDCAVEAKCYSTTHAVGVKEMSRLISRIRYRQFGVLVTTGYVNSQAYKEVVEDKHPILIVTASDIAIILRKSQIGSQELQDWLVEIDSNDDRTFNNRIFSYLSQKI